MNYFDFALTNARREFGGRVNLDALDLPSLNGQPGRPVPKGKTRLEESMQADADEESNGETWRTAVYVRDKYRCRCCGCKVKRSIGREASRATPHHIKRRDNLETRFDRRNGLTLCLWCHERVTGKVNDRLDVIGTVYFDIDGRSYIDGDHKVTFAKVA